MTDVKVKIASNDAFVGAMAKALAVKIGGYKAVSGTRDGKLEVYGSLTFHFKSDYTAIEFREAVEKFLGMHGAIAE